MAGLALIHQVITQLAIAIDLAAAVPGLTDQLRLPGIVSSALAKWAVLPSIKSTGLDAQTTTHRPTLELVTIIGNKRVSRFASLAKYAVAFLRNSYVRFFGDFVQSEAEGLGSALQIADHSASIALLVLSSAGIVIRHAVPQAVIERHRDFSRGRGHSLCLAGTR